MYHSGYDREKVQALEQKHAKDHAYNLDACHAKGECDAVRDMRAMLVDLSLLKECDYFVGGFSTNVARLAYELMTAHKGCYVPFISTDMHWCHYGGQRAMD